MKKLLFIFCLLPFFAHAQVINSQPQIYQKYVKMLDSLNLPNLPNGTSIGLVGYNQYGKLVKALSSSSSTIVSFTSQTGYTINWQTDIVPGYSVTYASFFGNNPNPFVYLGGVPIGQPFTITYSGALISTITFDWGVSQSGFIRF